jgi:hypothetical protein
MRADRFCSSFKLWVNSHDGVAQRFEQQVLGQLDEGIWEAKARRTLQRGGCEKGQEGQPEKEEPPQVRELHHETERSILRRLKL